MNIEFKKIAKQACIGFSMAALLGSLAACSGSGSPAAAPAANNNNGGTDNNNGDNGGNTGGEKPCIDTSLGKPNILLPILPKIEYQYAITNGDSTNSVSTNLKYECAADVPNGSKSVYPLQYELLLDVNKPDESFTVNEFMSSEKDAIKIYGYSIVGVPLSILSEGTKGKINVDIFPQNPLQLAGGATETTGEYQHNYGVTKLVFKNLVINDLYDALQDLFLSLKKDKKAFEGITEDQITAGIGYLKEIKFNPFENGLPVNGTGSATLTTNQEETTWKGQKDAVVITTVKQKMDFSISSDQFISPLILVALRGLNTPLDFSFSIQVNASYKLEPNVGPIERVYTVEVIDNNAQKAEAQVTAEADKTATATESVAAPTFTAKIQLQSIVNGDSDKDYIMDVVDDEVTSATVQ